MTLRHPPKKVLDLLGFGGHGERTTPYASKELWAKIRVRYRDHELHQPRFDVIGYGGLIASRAMLKYTRSRND